MLYNQHKPSRKVAGLGRLLQ